MRRLCRLISPHHTLASRCSAKAHRCRPANAVCSQSQCFLIEFSMLLCGWGAVNRALGGKEGPPVGGVHLGVTMLPCETMCIVLVVCVFASAVFAPTLMEGFLQSHHGKDCSHFTKQCNPKTQYIACYACVIKVEVT